MVKKESLDRVNQNDYYIDKINKSSACSSGGERLLDAQEVGGSKPPGRTIFYPLQLPSRGFLKYKSL